MAWVYLVIAGAFEVGWAMGLKQADGFSKFWPSVFTVLGMLLSFVFLSQALKTLPLGTGYAVWTGIGTVGTAILGMAILGEPRDVGRVLCIALIVAGIIGLKTLSSP